MINFVVATGHLLFRFTFVIIMKKFKVSNRGCFLFGVIGSIVVRFFVFKYHPILYYIAAAFIHGCLNSLITYNGMMSLTEYLNKNVQGKLTSGLNFNIIIHGLVWLLFIYEAEKIKENITDMAKSVTVEHLTVNLIIVIFCSVWKR
jgi:hypothetical protein